MLTGEEAVNSAYFIPSFLNSKHLRGADQVKLPTPLVIRLHHFETTELSTDEYFLAQP